eukprot:gene4497-5702_t
MTWGVSQAAPLRNVIAKAGLSFYGAAVTWQDNQWKSTYAISEGIGGNWFKWTVDVKDEVGWRKNDSFPMCDYSSGGYAANIRVEGDLNQGSQQQFCFRNVDANRVEGGAWSFTYVGCQFSDPNRSSRFGIDSRYEVKNVDDALDKGIYGFVPGSDLNSKQFVSVDETPVIAEKPFISFDDLGNFYKLNVPGISQNKTGFTMLSSSINYVKQSPFSNAATGKPDSALVYVTWPVDFNHEEVITPKDAARTMQAALDLGKDLIISPGIYELDQPLTVKFHDQVILCIEMATLVAPTNGQPCVKVLKGLTG